MAEYRQKPPLSPSSASKLEVYEEKCTLSPTIWLEDIPSWTKTVVLSVIIYRWGIEV
jgi:hypothetical protein